MLDEEVLDAVAICSPARNHEDHLARAVASGVHVFCEKPLVWCADRPSAPAARCLAEAAAARNRVLWLNRQWAETLGGFAALHGAPAPTRRVRLELSPAAPGPMLVADSAPHLIALLQRLGADGRIADVRGWIAGDGQAAEVRCTVWIAGREVEAILVLRVCPEQPRPAAYEIDDRRVDRVIAPDGYRISFRSGAVEVAIPDPLETSVAGFVTAAREGVALDPEDLVRACTMFDALTVECTSGGGRGSCP
jgi:hypothetical protein